MKKQREVTLHSLGHSSLIAKAGAIFSVPKSQSPMFLSKNHIDS